MKGHTLPGIKQRKGSALPKLEVFKGEESLGEGPEAVKAGKLAEIAREEARNEGISNLSTEEEIKEQTDKITYTDKDAKDRIQSIEDQREYAATGKLVK